MRAPADERAKKASSATVSCSHSAPLRQLTANDKELSNGANTVRGCYCNQKVAVVGRKRARRKMSATTGAESNTLQLHIRHFRVGADDEGAIRVPPVLLIQARSARRRCHRYEQLTSRRTPKI